MQWQIYCSWPVSAVNPSSQCPLRMRQRAQLEQRQESHLLTARAIPMIGRQQLKTGKVRLLMQLVQPNVRYRDEAEMLQSCQAVITGIADAIGIDEGQCEVQYDLTPEPVKPGGIRVTICGVETAT